MAIEKRLIGFKVYERLRRIYLRQSVKTRRAGESQTPCTLRSKSCWLGKLAMFFYHLWAGIHGAWWLGRWDFCGCLLFSPLVMLTKGGLYAIVLANSRMIIIPGAMLTSNYFFIFFILIKSSRKWLISWKHCTLSEFSNKLLKQQKPTSFSV